MKHWLVLAGIFIHWYRSGSHIGLQSDPCG